MADFGIGIVRGNEDNLEGRVLFYSRISLPDNFDQEEGIIGLYLTDNAQEFVDKFDFPEEKIEKIIEDSTKRIKQIPKRKGIVFPIYAARIVFENEHDVLEGANDVIFTGKYFHLKNCVKSLDIGLEFYLNKYFEQQKDRGLQIENRNDYKWEEDEEENRSSDIEETIEKLAEENIPGADKKHEEREFEEQIKINYVIPIIEAVVRKQRSRANKLGEDFIEFGAGSPFKNDVRDLYFAIKENPENEELIDFYIQKITAINFEDYEIAAEMRDKIIKLKEENKSQ